MEPLFETLNRSNKNRSSVFINSIEQGHNSESKKHISARSSKKDSWVDCCALYVQS